MEKQQQMFPKKVFHGDLKKKSVQFPVQNKKKHFCKGYFTKYNLRKKVQYSWSLHHIVKVWKWIHHSKGGTIELYDRAHQIFTWINVPLFQEKM